MIPIPSFMSTSCTIPELLSPERAEPTRRIRAWCVPLLLLLSVVGCEREAPHRRIILTSFDALSEARARETVPASAIPTFSAMFNAAACAASARPAFPSVTAPGHAALWTGAYGNVNGIAANAQPVLPRGEHTLLSSVSGYFVDGLRAEPLWITAARAGLRVAGHHVTQAPGAPGYAGVDGEDSALAAQRALATQALSQEPLFVMNGYNVLLSPTLWLTEQDAPPRAAEGWRGTDALASGVPPLEIGWLAGTDSLYGLLFGERTYDRVLVSPSRDASLGTIAIAAPVDSTSPDNARALARHFADAVLFDTERGPTSLTARLFSVSPDGQRYELLVPELRVVQANHDVRLRQYLTDIGGWMGNSALGVYRSGRMGARLVDGGDGLAEARLLESLQLLTRQYIRGSEWMWTQHRADLLMDYFPLLDEIDHEWFGLVDSTATPHDPALAKRVQRYRVAAWRLADLRLQSLRALVAGDANAAIIVSGDHGMRSYWKSFRPNVALREAGLLALDSAGRVDLSRTRAYSPSGYYVMLNRSAWKEGIVTASEEAETIAAVERALKSARGPDGAPIVSQLWRADAPGADTLGLGGPTGGDVYYDLGRGYYYSSGVSGEMTGDYPSPLAGHGFPSTSPEMQTVLCLWGDGVATRRIGPVRNADAPLVSADWLGVPHPANATGRSPYGALVGGTPR